MDDSKGGYRRIRRLTPSQDFYELFNESQVLNIVTSLDLHRAIPLQYSYFGSGASRWSEYVQRMAGEETPNTLVRTQRMLEINFDYLKELIAQHHQINVVDIGPGDCRPVKEFLRRLQTEKLLGRYVALDTSAAMLDIAAENMRDWFDGTIEFEGHQIDMTRESFWQLLNGKNSTDDESGITVALLLGGTLSNFPDPDSVLAKIRESVNQGDLLIYAVKLDSPRTRLFFDFNTTAEVNSPLSRGHLLVLDLLHIDPTIYEVEKGFDLTLKRRYIQVRLRESIEIEFTVGEARKAVTIEEGEAIILWHFWHHDQPQVRDQLVRCGFYPLLLSEHPDHDYMLCIGRAEDDLLTDAMPHAEDPS